MEVLSSILASVMVETSRLICGSLYSNIKSTTHFKLNLDKLEKEMKKLKGLSIEIKHQLRSAEIDGRSTTTKLKDWLQEVEELVQKVDSIQEGEVANDRRLCAHLLGCSRRIKLGKKVARMLKQVQRLLEEGSFQDGMVFNYPPRTVEHIPGPLIEDQTAASRTLAEVMKILDDDSFRRIGVWGMGGVGKTTLVKSLNNKLKSTSLMQPFSIVIWATVSKDLDLKRVQSQIAERLNLEVNREESIERTAIQLYQRLEKEEKFLLVLDDVWEKIDLDCLGIPRPEVHAGSKIILTSRTLDVCREMMTDIEVKVNVLEDEEAWELFCQNAGEVVALEHIKPYAEAIAKECCGLPLAIITAGAAMRGKTMVELWKHALNELEKSVPSTGSIKNKVYNPLKLSYDSLEDDNVKACFLYCALFSEDFSIEVSELVQCWLAEGLINEMYDHDQAANCGFSLIEKLKDSCLLEHGARDGTVKMHDVVRDVALWIASSLEDKSKFLVRSGIGLSEISKSELSNSLKRVSFMNNKISKLPDCEMQCSEASTLLLQGNLPLDRVPEAFLQAFQALRVLNISRTRIQSLPPRLQLCELRALMLHDCFFLEELPPLGALSKLQVIDLCATRIKELPKEMENLTNLRQVDLSRTHHLQKIHGGIVSKWACLEVLDMTLSSYHWGMKGEVEEGQATFEELGCLKRLVSLSVRMKRIPSQGSEDLWIRRLRKFQFFIGSTANSLPTKHDKRRVTISGLNLSGEWIGWLLINASSLVLNGCWGLNEMLQNLAIDSADSLTEINSSISTFSCLKSLTISSSSSILRPAGGCAAPCDLLPNLEELHLHSLTYLESISELVGHLGLLFSKLKLIQVTRCPQIKCLLSCGNFILTLPNLETINVSFCDKLSELFNYTLNQISGEDPIVPKLRTLELKNLPKLKTLCRPREAWPQLQKVDVVKCRLLRNLPLCIQNENTIKEIRGESQWWSGLKWDNEQTESSLQKFFKPTILQTTGSVEDIPAFSGES